MKIRGPLAKVWILLSIVSITIPPVSLKAQEKRSEQTEVNQEEESATLSQEMEEDEKTKKESDDSSITKEEPDDSKVNVPENPSEKKVEEESNVKEPDDQVVENKGDDTGKEEEEETKSEDTTQNSSQDETKQRNAVSEKAETRSEISVSDETGFRNALRNKSISKINITSDFTINSGYADFAAENRSLIIEGNGHTIDFRGMTVLFNTTTTNPLRIEVRNLTMFGQNYYGPIRMYGIRGTGSILYHNITYTGAQMTASYEADIEISGDVKVDTVLTYTSLSGTTISTQGSGQQNFEATNLRFLAGSTYRGTTINSGAFELYSGGSVHVEHDALIEVSSSGVGGETPTATIESGGNFYIEENAKVKVSSTRDSDRGGLALGVASEVMIEKGASLSIISNGRLAYPGLSIGDRAKFIVRDRADFDIQSNNQGTSTIPSIRTGTSSTFLIGDESSFQAVTDGTGVKNLIYVGGSSSFQFANAKRVNLQLDNSNANSRLLYMVSPSSWKVDVQSIKAWTTNVWDGDTNENLKWNPMFGMNISYSGSNVTKAEGQSVNQKTAESFRTEFRTQNFRRVLLEFIPSVMIDLNPLSDNRNKDNSHVLSGAASPNAYIRFSGDNIIPVGEIESPISTEENYHIQADEHGQFLFILPESQYLTASTTIKAYAFLDGKSQEDSEQVQDETAPEKPVLNQLSDQSTSMKGVTEPLAQVLIYDEAENMIGSISADEEGKYTCNLSENQLPLRPRQAYYAIAVDKAGNQSERSEQSIVKDTLPPVVEVTLQRVKTGYHLPDDYRDLFDSVSDNDANGKVKIETTENPNFDKVGYQKVSFQISDASDNAIHVDVPFFVYDESVTFTEDYAFSVKKELVWSWKEVPLEEELLTQKLVNDSKLMIWRLTDGKLIEEGYQREADSGVKDEPGTYQVKFTFENLAIPINVEVRDGDLIMNANVATLDYGTQKIGFMTTFHKPVNNPVFTISDERKNMSSWRLTARVTEDPTLTQSGFGVYQNGEFTKLVTDEETLAFEQEISQEETSIDLSLLQFKQASDIKHNDVVEQSIQWTLTDAP